MRLISVDGSPFSSGDVHRRYQVRSQPPGIFTSSYPLDAMSEVCAVSICPPSSLSMDTILRGLISSVRSGTLGQILIRCL